MEKQNKWYFGYVAYWGHLVMIPKYYEVLPHLLK